jgi:hypothetical protein
MEVLFGLAVVAFGFSMVVAAIVGLAIRSARSARKTTREPTIAPDWQPPKADPDPLPYLKKKYFFSAAERSFYEVVRRLAPEFTLFAKVRLADLVYVKKGSGSWQSHFNRINRKHIDFVLCNPDLAPVVAIELDDSSHDIEERETRDQLVDAVLAAATLPVVHIRARRGYSPDELREALQPYLPAKSPAEVPQPDERYMPPKGWRPAI